MSTSRMEILELLAKGKISANEAADLLSKPAETDTVVPAKVITPEPTLKAASDGQKPSWLHVRVRDMASGRNKVTVNVPLGFVKLGLKIGGRLAPELHELNWHDVEDMMMQPGVLVDVENEEGGEHVQVFID